MRVGKAKALKRRTWLILETSLAINAFKREVHAFLESLRHRKWALTYLIALACISTIVFSFVEHHSPFDSFYWTITVLSTVGFGDITPHTIVGKTLFIVVAISGITTYVYLITSWQTSIIEARLERKMWELAELDFKGRTRKSKSQFASWPTLEPTKRFRGSNGGR